MYVSIRNETVRHAGFVSLADGLNAIQLDAFEAAIDRDMNVSPIQAPWEERVRLDTPGAVKAFRQELGDKQLRVSALLLANDFSRPELDAEIDWVVRCAHLGDALGVDALRIDAIMHPGDESEWPMDRRIAVFIESMNKILMKTDGLKPQYGIENHGWPGNDPEFLRLIIHGVSSPRLGNTLDTANFYWSGKPLSEVHRIIEQFAVTTKHTHMKNIAFPQEQRDRERERGWGYAEYCCAVYEGDIDMPMAVNSLREAGYKADLCIENESLGRYPEEQRQEYLRKEVEYLKGLLQQG